MDMDKVKCNYHLKPTTKKNIDTLHKETGIARGVLIDMLVSYFGTDVKNIIMKGEPQPVKCADAYSAE